MLYTNFAIKYVCTHVLVHLISLLLRKGLADNTLFISSSTPQLVYVTVVHYTNDVIALVKRTIIQKVDSFKTWPFFGIF